MNAYTARLTASYEVDLFGRVSSNVAAARGDAGAVEATYRSVLLSLQADVAQTYFRVRSLDAEIATVEHTVALRDGKRAGHATAASSRATSASSTCRAPRPSCRRPRADAIGLQRQTAPTTSTRWPSCWANRHRASPSR